MFNPALDPLEAILRQCATAEPSPWYPAAYARENGIRRDDLDPYLDRLRMGGLIHLTDWVQGNGQGYALTAEGMRVLQSPRELARLRAGQLPAQAAPLVEPADHSSGREMSTWDRGEAIRNALLFHQTPVISIALIAINLAWFLIGMVIAQREQVPPNQYLSAPPTPVLEQIGAVRRNDVLLEGQWWRLLTCCFVHIGLIHLGVNMYSLYAVGPFFERLWGRARFLVLYLIAGFGGSCAMVLFQDPRVTGAGASGALWGILAGFPVWVLLNRHFLPGALVSSMLRQIAIVFALNIFITFSIPNISAAAHFGGGAVGAVAGFLLNYQRFGRPWQRWLALLGLLALPMFCVAALIKPEAVVKLSNSTRLFPGAERRDLQERCLPAAQNAEQEAKAFIASGVAPLQKRKPSDWTAGEVSQAVSALTEARAKLNAALELLRESGPYRDSRAEEGRQKLMAILQEEVRDYDMLEFANLFLPYLMRIEGAAFQSDTARALRDLRWFDPTARFADEVRATLAALEERQTEFAQVAAMLKKSGPYSQELLEKQRQLTAELAEAEAELLRLDVQCLRQGAAWTREEQIRLVGQKDRVKELTRQWKQVLSSQPEPRPSELNGSGRFIPRSRQTQTL